MPSLPRPEHVDLYDRIRRLEVGECVQHDLNGTPKTRFSARIWNFNFSQCPAIILRLHYFAGKAFILRVH